jgi:CHAD domain-containing protein
MAEGKWISGLEAETPVAQAARHALSVRLEVVAKRLPLAVHEADADPEHVHQLRVSTRRADAVLRIFRQSLPRKSYKWARQRLRRLRRAAGAARDWDVFLGDLQSRTSRTASQKPGLDFLAGFATGRRAAAQEELAEVGTAQIGVFDTFREEVVAAVCPPDGTGADVTLLSLARPLLARRMACLEQAVAGDLGDYTQLHQVRIAGKRLRYGMEIFAGCFPAAFSEVLYPQVEEMQEILGRANDSHVASEVLLSLREHLRRTRPAWWSRVRAGLEAVLRSHQRRLPQERKRFLRWWDQWQKPQALAQWSLLLGPKEEVGMGKGE